MQPHSEPLHHFHYSAVKYVINRSTANRESIAVIFMEPTALCYHEQFPMCLGFHGPPCCDGGDKQSCYVWHVTVHFEQLDTQEFMFHSLGICFQTKKNFLMLTGVHKKAIHFSPMHPPISNENQHTVYLHTIPLPTEPKHLPFVGHAHPTE